MRRRTNALLYLTCGVAPLVLPALKLALDLALILTR